MESASEFRGFRGPICDLQPSIQGGLARTAAVAEVPLARARLLNNPFFRPATAHVWSSRAAETGVSRKTIKYFYYYYYYYYYY